MRMRHLLAAAAALAIAVVPASSAQTGAPKGKKPRVFFVEPKNGATVTSPVHMKFGIENYQIQAVPQGDVKTARPGVGHYHVGVDQACLKPGTEIVKGTPQWVHFGTGASEFDLQLTPGRHRISLAVGDDLHKAISGLCTTITINVSK